MLRNEMKIYDLGGNLLEIRSLSSSLVSYQYWSVDSSADDVFVANVFNNNIELIDPINRDFSRETASISFSQKEQIIPDDPGEFTPPSTDWPSYQPETTSNYLRDNLWVLGLLAMIAIIPILVRRFRK